ncbi:MAG: aspartate aminotransferase family protein [Bacteroidia bacterium]
MNQKQIFLAHQAQTTHFPLMMEMAKAEGNYIYDTDGKKYLDLISGISVSHLGHGNLAVKEAIKNQVDDYMHLMVYGEFIQSPQIKLSQKLSSLLPQNLNCIYLVNSGAEATDGALKLVKRITKRSKIIANKNAYHGSTHAALSLNSEEYYKQAFRPLLPDIEFIEFNNINEIEKIDHQTACVITEVIQGEAGYLPAKLDFLKALRKKCDETCTLLIFDEIQSGMGKTGTMFAFEQYGVIPDILLLGKALGAGMPIGAFISSKAMMNTLADEPILGHITTFGGHPVIAAAALAGINELERMNLMSFIPEKENLFRRNLIHPAIEKISGKGLMLAVQLDSFENNLKVIQYCMEAGLITDWFLFANNKIRIAPPLTITNEEILHACSIIVESINKVYGEK